MIGNQILTAIMSGKCKFQRFKVENRSNILVKISYLIVIAKSEERQSYGAKTIFIVNKILENHVASKWYG